MESNAVPIVFFGVAAAQLTWTIVRNLSWSIDKEMMNVRRTIEKGLVQKVKDSWWRPLLLGVAVAFGSIGMSFRIIWWVLAGLLVIFSAVSLIMVQFVTVLDLRTELIPEEEVLNKRVRWHKIAGCIHLIVLVGWVYCGLEYLPE